jgi:hypothetical protein
MSILRHTELDYKKINYKKPEKQGLIYYSAIDYQNNPFYLQSPKMVCKKNGREISEGKNNNLDMETLNVDFSFYDAFVNFDELNVKKTFENNKDWFGKDIPLEVIDNMYKRSNKPVKKDSKPIFSFKVPILKGNIQCQIYDQKKTCIDLNQLKEGTEIVCILHLKGLKFLKQHYYCDIYISQIKVFLEGGHKYTILDSYSFNDIEEEENELKELEKDLMLDGDFLESIRDKEKEKAELEIRSELDNAQKIIGEQENNIKVLENKLKQLN